MVASRSAKRSMQVTSLPLLAVLLMAQSVQGDRVWFGDTMDFHVIDGQVYGADNIFVANGTTLTLEDGIITAPDTGDDGESAVRIDNSAFIAMQGKISGGHGVGGTGVTISTARDSDYPTGRATFEAGVEVYGGDATRERTTKGGDAVQVLQSGSKAVFNGGKFVPGTGCTIKTCGTPTGDGNALQVIEGEAVIKGGSFEGVIFNVGGNVELHGCVEYDKKESLITGVLLDGSRIDVVYNGGNNHPRITHNPDICPPPDATLVSESGVGKAMIHAASVCAWVTFVLTMALL